MWLFIVEVERAESVARIAMVTIHSRRVTQSIDPTCSLPEVSGSNPPFIAAASIRGRRDSNLDVTC
jgi:hypothetical protein